MKFCLTFAAVALLGAVSIEAHAQQPWLADRRYGEGIGIKVGDLELHPGVSGEVGYDSNYFLRSTKDALQPDASYRLRITPSISLATLGKQRAQGADQPTLTFRGGAYVSYNELIAADSKNSSEFSDQRHVDVGSDLALNLFPYGHVGVDGYMNFLRVGQPSNDPGIESAFNRDSLRAGAGITWRPGGGLFDWRVGYEFLYNYFEKSAFTTLNNFQHTINMRGRWRFLPRTAVLYDGGYTFVDYAHDKRSSQSDGAIVRGRLGLNGLITSRLALLGLVGWAGTFYNEKNGQPAQQFDSIVAQAELKVFISGGQESLNAGTAPVGLSYASIGYTRDVSNSYLGNYFRRDRGYIGISYLLGGVFVSSLNAGISNLYFPKSFESDGVTPLTDNGAFNQQRFDASLFGEYRLSDTFGLNATVSYDQTLNDEVIRSQGVQDHLEFARWQAYLGARFFW
ncbi:MAG: hypothetical protein ABUL62_20770 [Myxococcales bacterium]